MDYKTAVELIGQNANPKTLGELLAQLIYWDEEESQQLRLDLTDAAQYGNSNGEMAQLRNAQRNTLDKLRRDHDAA